MIWPNHCVQGTRGADLASALEAAGVTEALSDQIGK